MSFLKGLTDAFKGLTPDGLADAARTGNIDKVKRIVEQKPNLLSTRDRMNWTPLHAAAVNGHFVIVAIFPGQRP